MKMNMNMKTRTFFVAAVCMAALIHAPAQDFILDWSVIAGGGGESSAGDFSLEATIGQPEAGVMSAGDFELSGGFWSIIAALDTPPAPTLSLTVSGSQVELSWPSSAGSFVLEEASTLTAPPPASPWTTMTITPQQTNGMEVVRIPLASGNRFYRLRQ